MKFEAGPSRAFGGVGVAGAADHGNGKLRGEAMILGGAGVDAPRGRHPQHIKSATSCSMSCRPSTPSLTDVALLITVRLCYLVCAA